MARARAIPRLNVGSKERGEGALEGRVDRRGRSAAGAARGVARGSARSREPSSNAAGNRSPPGAFHQAGAVRDAVGRLRGGVSDKLPASVGVEKPSLRRAVDGCQCRIVLRGPCPGRRGVSQRHRFLQGLREGEGAGPVQAEHVHRRRNRCTQGAGNGRERARESLVLTDRDGHERHIAKGAALARDRERAHGALVRELSLVDCPTVPTSVTPSADDRRDFPRVGIDCPSPIKVTVKIVV